MVSAMNETERLENLTEIKRLQDLAEKQAVANGHMMGKSWRLSQYGSDYICYCGCTKCHSGAIIDTRAERVISGSALRDKCDPGKLPF